MRCRRRPFTHEAVEEAFTVEAVEAFHPRRWRRPFTHEAVEEAFHP